MKIKDLPSDEKPREKALAKGLSSLADAELLALIVQTGFKGMDAVSLGREVISKSGGLHQLSKSIYTDLNIKGLGKAKKLKIMACFELGRRAEEEADFSKPIESADEAVEKFGKEIAFDREEKLMLVSLDSRRRFIKRDIVSYGNSTSTQADLQSVLQAAISCRAKYAYLIHNHPSGIPLPSDQDLLTTKWFVTAFRSVGTILIDHLVVSGDAFSSVRSSFQKRISAS